MKRYKKAFFLIISFLILYSCSQREKRTVIAKIDDFVVYEEDIDKLVTQELFDEANRIYLIKKLALDSYIDDYFLKKGLNNLNMSKGDLVDSLYKKIVDSLFISSFILSHNMQYGIKDLRNTLETFPINSEEGQYLLKEKIKNSLLKSFIDSIKSVSNISSFLYPPINPKLALLSDSIVKYSAGNLSSKYEILVVSDFECDRCRESYPIIRRIYDKNKNRVKFSFTNYSSYVSISAIAAIAAGRQGKYLEYSNAIYSLGNIPTLEDLNKIARNMNLDMTQFEKDFKDTKIKESLVDNNIILNEAGLYGTPTLIVNGKLIFDLSTEQEVQRIIENEFSE